MLFLNRVNNKIIAGRWFTFVLLLCFSLTSFSAQHFWRGKTISADEAVRRWGSVDFNADKFKVGDKKLRASMASSLKKKEREFSGKSVSQVRDILGAADGFYFSEIYPTYLIEVGKTREDETWQIVFLLNKDRLVENIIIHKNCCG